MHILERVLLSCLPEYGSLSSGTLGFVSKHNSANLYFPMIISFEKKKKQSIYLLILMDIFFLIYITGARKMAVYT